VVRRWLSSRERVSVLPAYTIEGYIAAKTFYGTCTGEIFEDFIVDQLLPLCNPYPGPRSVIIMDNASVHVSRHAGERGFGYAFCHLIRLISTQLRSPLVI
jgi:transposase